MSALSIPSVGLSTGYQIPQFGFGTYKIAPEDCVDAVKYALDLGIRHIDTAQMYHNEAEVGRAIEESGIPRDEIFLTTKLNNDKHLPEDARKSFQQSLEDLRT
ncbi:MAG: aldo/keto reductase, partial [Varibaculum cambriense]|nr:aldo/keto reductase [Varibaculum cambriense]